MQIINLILILVLIIGGFMAMFPKRRKIGLEFIKISIICYVIIYFAPILYHYFDKIIK